MPKKKLEAIHAGETRRVGAQLEPALYNALLSFATKMDVDMAWVARRAFREFIERHEDALQQNPEQLALDLGLS